VTPWVQRLLIANIGMYFVQITAPQIINPLVLYPPYLLVRPWTIVTYMFLHGGLMHIAFNMIALFFFGPRVESRLGARRFFIMYFVSGITGGLFTFIFAPTSPVIGASAGVFGVMLSFAYFWPRDQIMIWGIIPIQARWLVALTTVFAIYSGLGGSRGGVADFAHLGGYVGAYVYLRLIASNRTQKKFKQKAAGEVSTRVLGNWKRVDPTTVHALNRDEVNRILDKINATGLDSLTPEERLFLSNFVPLDDRPQVQ
jgi:membrane associated rhomboid family serine protease